MKLDLLDEELLCPDNCSELLIYCGEVLVVVFCRLFPVSELYILSSKTSIASIHSPSEEISLSEDKIMTF